MHLTQLIQALPEAEVSGPRDLPIRAIAYDSRAVEPHSLFVAIRGAHVDGHRFIGQALERGATAIVYEDVAARAEHAAAPVAWVRVPNSRAALSPLAAAFYGYPGRELRVVGVTGSKGKTTTSTLLAHVLDQEGHRSGLMTTVDFKVGARWWSNQTRQTTPEALEVQQMLRAMVEAGCDYAVVESSSHALSARWNRVGDCDYSVAVITNITHEHLDYHGSFEQYRRDKARLFELLGVSRAPGRKLAVINLDDPNAPVFIAAAGAAEVITYALEHPAAHVRAIDVELHRDGVRATALTPWGEVPIELGIPGRFNVLNALAAVAVGLAEGISPASIAAALRGVRGVSGRMERVELGQPFTVVVDYAHNPDSFEQVMGMLRPLTRGRLISVFGSAGERDQEKRPLQGRIAGRYCDLTIVTDEDPRDEDRMAILEQIAAGLRQAGRREGVDYLKIADRAAAIREALRRAQPGDIVLLLGKGHESSIIYEGGRKLPWNERAEAERALRELGYGG
ncbi:UDP-N-acetylmuramoyl-L-alanyl-D-glutamate--2,6-diaminopimelate ligase [Kallotenue papyrolyticum]|uniref:UDP-N-acetylmuramoyl-L-alanyl-D-glutamate--2, 6-diaminopimelate ligase n=1 Tax=Kallotenue papyrolyticum TaxID=1325125 RepID=UPI0004785FC5|nr:UDP-N-acetylmuramoyl-L-alanyl-D-glutamate--2,6-diaminopimelate ligase [Kallotenue papyrolyticum]